MNLKAVEMQIAVPRTNEAGRIQHEVQQRPLIDQSLLSAENIKQHEQQRQRSAIVDESAQNRTVKRDGDPQGERQGQASHGDQTEDQEKEQKHPAEHPYKGHHIDLSL
ncbi:hypothetical protein V3851_05010 [Paenibacillus sp. M1]|uniref:Uncharacterized protein n=1 Tax=Paenibacillus haidiansis TaxID=1574488 RepID=A0ABU7VN43_9BACL